MCKQLVLDHAARRITVCVAVLALASAHAGAQSWDGGGTNDNWTTANNWSPNGVPVNDGTANISFGGTTRLNPLLDVSRWVNSITFNNTAGAFVLSSSADSAMTLGGGGLTNNDATLQIVDFATITLAANQSWTAASGSLLITPGQIGMSSHQLVISGDFNTTLSGNVTGTGKLVKAGNGMLDLSAGPFGGDLQISLGTLRLGGDDLFIGDNVFDSGAAGRVLDLNGFKASFGRVNGSGTITDTGALPGKLYFGSDDSSFTLNVSVDNASITKIGTGTVTLGASFSIGGFARNRITVGAGTLVTAGRFMNNFADLSVSSLGTASLGGFDDTVGELWGSGTVSLGQNTLTLATGDPATFTGTITGTGGITKTSTNTWSLGGASIFSGTLDIQNGTVRLLVDEALPAAATINVASGATLDLAGFDDTIGTLTGGGDVIGLEAGSRLTLSSNAPLVSFNGTITLDDITGRLTKSGTGIWVLAGSYLGDRLLIQGGTLRFGSAVSIDDSVIVDVASGCVLDMDGRIGGFGPLIGAGQVINNNGSLHLYIPTGTHTFAGSMAGSGSVSKQSLGTLVINGDWSGFSGRIFVSGTLRLAAGVALNPATDVSFVDFGNTLDLSGLATQIDGLSGSGNVINNNNALVGLVIGVAGGTGSFGGVISGSGRVAKEGSGDATFYGANTYTGRTDVRAGRFFASNSTGSATGAGQVAVAGGTLGGDGTISGPVTVGAATLAPGETGIFATRTLTLGSLDLLTSATLALELAGPTAGTQYDRAAVTGSATLGGAISVTLINGYVPTPGTTFRVVTAPSMTGSFATYSLPPTMFVNYGPTYVDLVFNGCPGDADGNFTVDQDDMDLVLFYFGTSVTPWQDGDLDGDGDVDQDDLDLVLFEFGQDCT